MRHIAAALTVVLAVGAATLSRPDLAVAQTVAPAPAPETPAAAPASPAAAPESPAAAPAPASPVATVPSLKAKDLEGRDAFGSDGQQVGKVVKVNVLADGAVKDAEIHSSGFFGFFSSAYLVPAEKLSVKGGRVDISLTSEEVKKLGK